MDFLLQVSCGEIRFLTGMYTELMVTAGGSGESVIFVKYTMCSVLIIFGDLTVIMRFRMMHLMRAAEDGRKDRELNFSGQWKKQ